jgi:hypothetical protein
MKKVLLFIDYWGTPYYFFFDNYYLYLKSLQFDGLFYPISLNKKFDEKRLVSYSLPYNEFIFNEFKNADEINKTKYLFDSFSNISKLDINKSYFNIISNHILSIYEPLQLFANLYNREEKLNNILNLT